MTDFEMKRFVLESLLRGGLFLFEDFIIFYKYPFVRVV
jgi:hypothetical protein